MFGSKHLITSWDAFHLFIKIEIGVVGFALFCYFFFPSFFHSVFCKKTVRKKKSPYTSSTCVPSLSPRCLLSRGAAMGRNGPPWQSVGTSRIFGNWKVDRGADAKPSSHTAAVGAAGRREPCARCSGSGQERLRWRACSLTPPPCLRLHGALGPCLACWGSCVMGAETGLVLPL